MEAQLFEVQKHYTRGDKQGRTETATIKLPPYKTIYNYLWETVTDYDNHKVNFIINFYKKKKLRKK